MTLSCKSKTNPESVTLSHGNHQIPRMSDNVFPPQRCHIRMTLLPDRKMQVCRLKSKYKAMQQTTMVPSRPRTVYLHSGWKHLQVKKRRLALLFQNKMLTFDPDLFKCFLSFRKRLLKYRISRTIKPTSSLRFLTVE